MAIELRRGPWHLTDLADVPKNGHKVFSIFSCGGGSTMGYKLAGFEMVGCCDIDPQMLSIYRANHNPPHPYLMGVQKFKLLPKAELAPELFNLDVLDGSPPCSSFSTSGSRDKKWGEKKKFREGQAEQVLDDLFFDFIDVADRLRPKVVLAENVKGLILGKAKGYVRQIFQAFDRAGYDAQLFLLNASTMGVPQARERTFFLARRKDLGLPTIKLQFAEHPITVEEALRGASPAGAKPLGPKMLSLWSKCMPGRACNTIPEAQGSFFSWRKLHPHQVAPTITATACGMHWAEPRHLSGHEVMRLQSFPEDYNFLDADPTYVCGMSVAPFMMQRIAYAMAVQWFGVGR